MRFSRSFISGLSKSVELFPEHKREIDTRSGMQRDYQALRGDWINVGNDLRKGIERFYREECG